MSILRRLLRPSDERYLPDRQLHALQASISSGYACRFRIFRNAFPAGSPWQYAFSPKVCYLPDPLQPIAKLSQALEDDFRQDRASRRTDVGFVSSGLLGLGFNSPVRFASVIFSSCTPRSWQGRNAIETEHVKYIFVSKYTIHASQATVTPNLNI